MGYDSLYRLTVIQYLNHGEQDGRVSPPSRGKEEDIEVGLQYFGKRFYAPLLGRWLSADPAAVHALQADLNLYAYVSGRVFVAVDIAGLDGALPPLPLRQSGIGTPGESAIRWVQQAQRESFACAQIVTCSPDLGSRVLSYANAEAAYDEPKRGA